MDERTGTDCVDDRCWWWVRF